MIQMNRDIMRNKCPSIMRNKIYVDRKISKKLDAMMGYEFYSNFFNSYFYNRNRVYLGAAIDMGKNKQLDITYIYEKPVAEAPVNIISLSYSFSL